MMNRQATLNTSLALALTLALCTFTQVRAADAADTTSGAEAKHSYSEEAIRHYNRGHDLHQQGFFNQAIAEYKAALVADDRMEEAYTNLGLIYAAQRNYNKAIDSFRKSLELNPNRPNALNGLGTVLYAKNKFSEAMEKWKEAVKIDPKFASAYYNMGNALENEKDMRAAVDAYVNAISINPAMADAYYRVGSIYAKQKHLAQARLLLAKAVELEPTAEFCRDAKKTLSSIESDLAQTTDEPEVKMNVIAPPSTEPAAKSGGS
jgi:tetratricopeptide (TPR) repeat protein